MFAMDLERANRLLLKTLLEGESHLAKYLLIWVK